MRGGVRVILCDCEGDSKRDSNHMGAAALGLNTRNRMKSLTRNA